MSGVLQGSDSPKPAGRGEASAVGARDSSSSDQGARLAALKARVEEKAAKEQAKEGGASETKGSPPPADGELKESSCFLSADVGGDDFDCDEGDGDGSDVEVESADGFEGEDDARDDDDDDDDEEYDFPRESSLNSFAVPPPQSLNEEATVSFVVPPPPAVPAGGGIQLVHQQVSVSERETKMARLGNSHTHMHFLPIQ